MALTQTQAPTSFNCVHLPIVYEYTSSLFPTNTVDTARTVNSFSNDGGYCRLTLSGDIKASGSANELEYVSVVVDGVTGIYQIYNYYSDTDITIDLEYDAGIIFGNVQYYYSNYHGRFKIYAGLRSGHTLSSSKPFRLITEIKAVPDSTGVIKININEILKSDIDILDGVNTNNDIGQFTEFYVDFAESYDQSVDGYTLSSYVSAYTDNSANYALAVNSKLPFKNGYGGEMTQYVGSSRKFLNLGNTYFPGNNFYITYLVEPSPNDSNSYPVGVKSYLNGSLIYTASVGVTAQNEGVYNVLINSGVSATADEIEVYLTGESESKFITVDNTCSNQSLYLTWRNYLGGFDSWLFTAEKEYSIDIEEVKSAEKNIFIDWDASYNSDRIKFNTLRTARESVLVRSQNLTLNQLNFIKYIKTSPLVFSDRIVLVDEQSFMVYSETDKLYSISFSISYTDTIPSQSL